MNYFSNKINKAIKSAKIIPFDETSRIVIMSDCHRGVGNWSDNFSNNQNIFFAALSFYYEFGFTYIELGDGDELWENRKIENIIHTHSHAFWIMSQFYKNNRFYMLYGNHDIVKRNPEFIMKNCETYYCESTCCRQELFPDMTVYESIILQYRVTGDRIYLIHGHQADFLNSTLWRLSRFLVRYLWKPLELSGFRDPTSAAKNNSKKNTIERRLINWATNEKKVIIAGHTHRTVFPKVGEHTYFNDGSCVHPRCITAIEIIGGTISLVKWAVLTRPDRTLYVGREVLEKPVPLVEYFNTLR